MMNLTVAHLTIDLGDKRSFHAEYNSNHSTFQEGGMRVPPQLTIDLNDQAEAEQVVRAIENWFKGTPLVELKRAG